MDPVTGAALITGGAQLLGGLFGSRSASKASRAESQAAQDQLQFAREQFDYYTKNAAPMYQVRDMATAQLMADIGLPPIQVMMPGQQAPQQAQQQPQQQPQAAQIDMSKYQQIANNMYRDRMGNIFSGEQLAPQQQVAPTPQMAQPEQQAPQYFTPTAQNGLTAADQWQVDEAVKAAQMASGGRLGGRELRALMDRAGGIALQNRENRLNRLASLAGFAQTAGGVGSSLAQGAGTQALGAMGNIGAARSSGYINKANQLSGTLQGLSQLGGWAYNQGAFGGGGFTGTPSPGLAPGAMPVHLRGY